MPKNISLQVENLHGMLATELDRYSKGEMFLSTRALMKKYDVSRRTMEQALARLQDEGQIVVEQTCGIFVNRDRDRKVRNIVSVHPDWPSHWWKSFDRELETLMKSHSQYKFSKALYPPTSRLDYLELVNERMGDAIILPHPVGINNIAELAQVINANVQVIFMADNVYCAGINALSTQPEYAGMLAAKHFVSNGHTELAMILSEPVNPGWQRRINGYIDLLRLYGITPKIIDCKVQRGDASRSKSCDAMLSYLRKNGLNFTGCWTMSAGGVIDAIADFGLRVPDDISVIGCFEEAYGATSNPPLTTIIHDIKKMCTAIIDGLDDLFSGGVFGIRTVLPELIERKSVKNLGGLAFSINGGSSLRPRM